MEGITPPRTVSFYGERWVTLGVHSLKNSLTGLEDSNIRRLSRVWGESSSTIGNVSETCKV
jgi:hypothetical protein